MSQFDHNAVENILIIGHGRLAKHLQHWCSLRNLSIKSWNRNSNSQLSFENIDYIWLAISDDALTSFYIENIKPQLTHQKVVHFSGSVNHEEIASAHPLMTFSTRLYDLDFYEKIHFALTGCQSLDEVMPGFKNPSFQILAKDKALYHALCVTAGNLPQLLWSQTMPLFSDLKVPQQAISMFLKQSLNNYIHQGSSAVTGPISRNDQLTIKNNLSALEKVNQKLKNIYHSFL